MTAVELPTCKASPYRAQHHQRQWRILEGLSLFDGGPLPISAGEAWDIHVLGAHGLVKVYAGRGGLQLVTLAGDGRRLLDARDHERERELAAGGEVRS